MKLLQMSILHACLCVAPVTLAATPLKPSVGGASIDLPAPKGFNEPSEEAPILRSRAETLTAPQMRLLGVYVSDSDLRLAQQSSTTVFKTYFMAQVLRDAEADSLDINSFANVKAQIRDVQSSSNTSAQVSLQEHANSAAKQIGVESGFSQLKLNIGEMKQFGVVDETERSITTLSVARVATSGGRQELSALMGQATAVVLLRGKVVFLAAYSQVESTADYSRIQQDTKAWAQAALQANRE